MSGHGAHQGPAGAGWGQKLGSPVLGPIGAWWGGCSAVASGGTCGLGVLGTPAKVAGSVRVMAAHSAWARPACPATQDTPGLRGPARNDQDGCEDIPGFLIGAKWSLM